MYGSTSQLITAQVGDLQLMWGALQVSGAPGPVVTSQRSDREPYYLTRQSPHTYLRRLVSFPNQSTYIQIWEEHKKKIFFLIRYFSPQPC